MGCGSGLIDLVASTCGGRESWRFAARVELPYDDVARAHVSRVLLMQHCIILWLLEDDSNLIFTMFAVDT